MAKDHTQNKAPDIAAPSDATDGWIEIQDHRPMYMPKESGMGRVRGYMLGTKEMNPSNKNVKSDVPVEEQYWVAIVFLLTKPATLRSPEGDFREYPPGTQCLVGGADLASLYNRADDRSRCFEVEISPTKEMSLGGGRRMMLFTKRVNPTFVQRQPGSVYEFLEGRATSTALDPFADVSSLNSASRPALPPIAQSST